MSSLNSIKYTKNEPRAAGAARWGAFAAAACLTWSLAKLRFFFFFQAEDGIRDGRVTGVQMCALPISSSRQHAENGAEGGAAQDRAGATLEIANARPHAADRTGHDARCLLLFEIVDDLGDAIDRHRERDEFDAVGKPRHAEIETACARIDVSADEAEQQ